MSSIEDQEFSSEQSSDEEKPINSQQTKTSYHTSHIGTPLYASPEQEKLSSYDYKTDIYSLGMVLFEMLSKFGTGHERELRMKELRNKRIIEKEMLQCMPNECALITRMTEYAPTERPTAEEALEIVEGLISSDIS